MNEAVALRTEAAPTTRRLERLFAAHYAWVWRTLRRLGVPEASVDDAAQQVFLVVSKNLERVEKQSERAYLMSVALRVASNARRSASRRRDEADRRNVLVQRTLAGALAVEQLGDAIVARHRELPL